MSNTPTIGPIEQFQLKRWAVEIIISTFLAFLTGPEFWLVPWAYPVYLFLGVIGGTVAHFCPEFWRWYWSRRF